MSYGPHIFPRYSHQHTPYLSLSAHCSNVSVKHPDALGLSSSSLKNPDGRAQGGNDKNDKHVTGSSLVAKHSISTTDKICSVQRMALSALDTPRLKDTCYYCFEGSEDSHLKKTPPKRQRNDTVSDLDNFGGATKPKLKVCTGCRVVKFCDKSCQSSAWDSHHKFECPIYAALQPRILPNNVRAIVRLLLQKKNNRLPTNLFEDIAKLKSHVDDLRDAGGTRWENLVIMAQGIKEYSKTDQEFSVVLKLLCILLINSFTLMTCWNDPIGLCLHPLLARMNHNCEPNAYIHFPVQASQDIKIIPLRKIRKHDEITISYVDTTEPVERRQKELLERYFFTCECSKCSREKVEPMLLALDTIKLEAPEAKAFQYLEAAMSNTSVSGQIETIRYGLFVLEDSEKWPVTRDPYPRLLHKLILAYIDDQQFNIALAYSAIQHLDVDPLVFSKDFHPTRLTHTMLFVRLMSLAIDAQSWTLQELDLRPFGLNLLWLRRYLLRGMQRSLSKTCVDDLSSLVQGEINIANRCTILEANGDKDLDKQENFKKAMEGVLKMTAWAYEKIRTWPTA